MACSTIAAMSAWMSTLVALWKDSRMNRAKKILQISRVRFAGTGRKKLALNALTRANVSIVVRNAVDLASRERAQIGAVRVTNSR
jgi:hypothetical protein